MKKLIYGASLLLFLSCTGQTTEQGYGWRNYEVVCLTADQYSFTLELSVLSRNDSASTAFLNKCKEKIRVCTLDSFQENYKRIIADIWSEAREDRGLLAVEFPSKLHK